VKEILNHDWDAPTVICRACVEAQHAELFKSDLAAFPPEFPKFAPIYSQQRENTQWVTWKMSCREFVNLDYPGCFENFTQELLKLGDPERTRIIFWFI
jgi:hypothetical protein